VVSVVVPAYNAKDWIGFTLKSACAQTLREIEVLVVDDGSSDGTADIADAFAARDPRIRVIRQANAGVGAARNTAIREARGRFIAPLDADDLWDPTKLEKQVACMDRCGDRVGMVYCDSWYLDQNGVTLAHESEPVNLTGNCRRRLIYSNFIGNASVPLFRAEALQRCGLYLTREEQGGAQGCEDWDLMLRVAEQWEFAPVPERLVGYRQALSCMSAVGSGMTESFWLVLERARKRNPDLPAVLFDWSEAHFQRYRFRKCFDGGDYATSLQAANRAIKADRLMLLDSRMHRMMLKGLLRLVRKRIRGEAGLPSAGATPGAPGSVRRPSPLWRPLDRACINLQRRLTKPRLKFIDGGTSDEIAPEIPEGYRNFEV